MRSKQHPWLALQSGLAKIGSGIELLAVLLGSFFLCVLAGMLFVQVVCRYLLFVSIPWIEEGATFSLAWLAMMSIVVAARRGLHFIFRLGTSYLPLRSRSALRTGVNVLVSAFLAILTVESWFYLSIVSNQSASVSGINMALPYASIFLGSLGLLLVYVLDVLDALLGLKTGLRLSDLERHEEAAYSQLAMYAKAHIPITTTVTPSHKADP